MDAGYSLSDVAAIVGKNNDGFLGGNGVGFIILILFLLMMGGGSFWGGAATANTITNDFLYTNLSNQLGRTGDRIENTMNTGFTAVAQQGFQIDKDILNQTNTINQSINNLGYQMQNCCCDLKTAIHAEGEATRALITENTIQQLRTDLQAAQLTLGNANQTQNILNALGTYTPYGATNCGCGCGY